QRARGEEVAADDQLRSADIVEDAQTLDARTKTIAQRLPLLAVEACDVRCIDAADLGEEASGEECGSITVVEHLELRDPTVRTDAGDVVSDHRPARSVPARNIARECRCPDGSEPPGGVQARTGAVVEGEHRNDIAS